MRIITANQHPLRYNIGMDCMEYNKCINSYLKGSLEAEKLGAFLRHTDECERCRKELEINFIVREGISILENDRKGYDLDAAFRSDTLRNKRRFKTAKFIRRLSYIVLSIMFWAVAASFFMFLRVGTGLI